MFNKLYESEKVYKVEHFGQFQKFQTLVKRIEMMEKKREWDKGNKIDPEPAFDVSNNNFFPTGDVLTVFVKINSVEIYQNIEEKYDSDNDIIYLHYFEFRIKETHFHR